jgi:hypothetical protein
MKKRLMKIQSRIDTTKILFKKNFGVERACEASDTQGMEKENDLNDIKC